MMQRVEVVSVFPDRSLHGGQCAVESKGDAVFKASFGFSSSGFDRPSSDKGKGIRRKKIKARLSQRYSPCKLIEEG